MHSIILGVMKTAEHFLLIMKEITGNSDLIVSTREEFLERIKVVEAQL